MKNWIDTWRPKVENQYSGDALYLQHDGKPFTAQLLIERVRSELMKGLPKKEDIMSVSSQLVDKM